MQTRLSNHVQVCRVFLSPAGALAGLQQLPSPIVIQRQSTLAQQAAPTNLSHPIPLACHQSGCVNMASLAVSDPMAVDDRRRSQSRSRSATPRSQYSPSPSVDRRRDNDRDSRGRSPPRNGRHQSRSRDRSLSRTPSRSRSRSYSRERSYSRDRSHSRSRTRSESPRMKSTKASHPQRLVESCVASSANQ